jgi:hypothetical protein
MRKHSTPKRDAAQAVKIRRTDGKTIGLVVNGVFKKTARASKHFLRVPEAIAFDLSTLADAKEHGARVVEVTDAESGKTYRATIARVWAKGFHVERGHGAQIALVLAEWNKDSELIADQLTLF